MNQRVSCCAQFSFGWRLTGGCELLRLATSGIRATSVSERGLSRISGRFLALTTALITRKLGTRARRRLRKVLGCLPRSPSLLRPCRRRSVRHAMPTTCGRCRESSRISDMRSNRMSDMWTSWPCCSRAAAMYSRPRGSVWKKGASPKCTADGRGLKSRTRISRDQLRRSEYRNVARARRQQRARRRNHVVSRQVWLELGGRAS